MVLVPLTRNIRIVCTLTFSSHGPSISVQSSMRFLTREAPHLMQKYGFEMHLYTRITTKQRDTKFKDIGQFLGWAGPSVRSCWAQTYSLYRNVVVYRTVVAYHHVRGDKETILLHYCATLEVNRTVRVLNEAPSRHCSGPTHSSGIPHCSGKAPQP